MTTAPSCRGVLGSNMFSSSAPEIWLSSGSAGFDNIFQANFLLKHDQSADAAAA